MIGSIAILTLGAWNLRAFHIKFQFQFHGLFTEIATQMAEIQNCSSEPEPTAINECEGQASMKSTTQSSEASDTTSSRKENKGKGKAAAFKRRNPRVLVRRHRANNVDTIGLPLGMSFAAVMAQVCAAIKVRFLIPIFVFLGFNFAFDQWMLVLILYF